jgi:radical SAM superfamily enzyme YgiQ (UPF0313 family)
MGVLTLAAMARGRGWRVDVVPLPPAGEADRLIARLRDVDLVGFTSVCSTYPRVLALAAMLRRADPQALIVLGGPQATTTASATVARHPAVDLILKGEAEVAWAQLLDQIAAGGARDWRALPGAVFREGGAVREVAMAPLEMNLDALPGPAYDLDPAFGDGSRLAFEIGRGCPYACTFCSTNDFFKRRFRMKSPAHIVQELESLQSRYGTQHLDFIHDMFTVRRDTVEAICDALDALGLSWNCSARTDRLDMPLLARMARSGCTGIYVGLETGSARLQREVKKNLRLDAAISTIRLCQAMGLHVTASLIFGYPQERAEDLAETLRCYFELLLPHPSPMARGLVTPQLHLFAPLAGTPILATAGAFAFDRQLSSTVALESGDTLTAEETEMVAQDFELFSAFYHATGNPVGRARLLALDAVFSGLPQFVATCRQLSQQSREDFVGHLLSAPFVDWDGPPPTGAALLCLLDFSARRPFDGGLRQALNRDLETWHRRSG